MPYLVTLRVETEDFDTAQKFARLAEHEGPAVARTMSIGPEPPKLTCPRCRATMEKA